MISAIVPYHSPSPITIITIIVETFERMDGSDGMFWRETIAQTTKDAYRSIVEVELQYRGICKLLK
jgi:hypothetical protein